MSLESALSAWNGKQFDDLNSIYRQFYKTPDFVNQLSELLKQKQQQGASALLKLYLENQHHISLEQSGQIMAALALAKSAETQLNLLACLPYLHPYPEKAQRPLARFIHIAQQSPHKAVQLCAEQAEEEYQQDFSNQSIQRVLFGSEKQDKSHQNTQNELPLAARALDFDD